MVFARFDGNSKGNVFIDGLNTGYYFSTVQSGSSSATPVITYFLEDSASLSWASQGAETAFKAALAAWSAVANIAFQEVSSASGATWVETLYSDGSDATLGAHYLPNNAGLGGEYNVGHPLFSATNNELGGVSFLTFLHEIGHGIGLDHPFEGNLFPGVTLNDPYDRGDNNFNNGIYTVMGYDDDPWFAVAPGYDYGYAATPMAFDIATIQAIYGANMSYATGNDTYVLPTANASGTFWSCIWDAGGADKISGETATGSVEIDLRAATLLNEEGGGGFISRMDGIFGGFTIANGVVIEEAIGSDFDDILIGNGISSDLRGGGGADVLHGNGIGDHLWGGTGNDTYYVTDRTDVVTEFVNGGQDVVYSSADFYRIGPAVEQLILLEDAGDAVAVGSGESNTITGNDLANGLYGNGSADVIYGMGGNDRMVGGENAVDTLFGGTGDDTYIINDLFDIANELAGEGRDHARVKVDYTLPENIEVLIMLGNALSGTGNDADNVIKGHHLDNTLTGLDGDDQLFGNLGDDVLNGGAGQDIFNGGGGADTFVFADGDFTGTGPGSADRIEDFSQAQGDIIDLSAVDAIAGGANDNFTLIGTASFSGTAGELRYTKIDRWTDLYADTDGDGNADLIIRLNGIHDLTASDFIGVNAAGAKVADVEKSILPPSDPEPAGPAPMDDLGLRPMDLDLFDQMVIDQIA